MSKKSGHIAALITALVPSYTEGEGARFDPHYLGYFECFNRQKFYEAHDVLEELWLKTKGPLHLFYKGLIQAAGAFVHLQKSKLNPAARLFRLALKNLDPYAPATEGLDVAEFAERIRKWLAELEKSNYTSNPYDLNRPPRVNVKMN